MAEPLNLEWMTEQRDRYKTECVALQRRCDELLARDKGRDSELQAAKDTYHAALVAERSAHTDKLAAIRQDLGKAQALADARKAALADILRAVATAVEKITPLLRD